MCPADKELVQNKRNAQVSEYLKTAVCGSYPAGRTHVTTASHVQAIGVQEEGEAGQTLGGAKLEF